MTTKDLLLKPYGKAEVHANGRVEWQTKLQLHSYCQLELDRFPFDTHLCPITFSSWTYEGYKLDLDTYGSMPARISNLSLTNSGWHLRSLDVRRGVQSIPGLHPVPEVTFIMHATRVSLYHRYLFILPAIALCVLSVFVFLLPLDSTEKISLGKYENILTFSD